MSLQVLVSTMNQVDHSLPGNMNIRSDAIIINQSDRREEKVFPWKGRTVQFSTFEERGVGKSRNRALEKADAPYLLFADDDVTYKNDYEKVILEEFEKHPKADVIIFNVFCTNDSREEKYTRRFHRAKSYNILKHGTHKIAVRTKSIKDAGINFSLLFGGGAIYGSGEDSLFLLDCLRANLNVFLSTKFIGKVTHEESTWFNGYNEKYFYDKGAWLQCAFSKKSILLIGYYTLRLKSRSSLSYFDIASLMLSGKQGFKSQKRYLTENFGPI